MSRRLAALVAVFALLRGLTATAPAATSAATKRARAATVRHKAATTTTAVAPKPTTTTTTLPPRRPLADPAGWDAAAFQATLDAWMASKPSVATVTVAIAGGGQLWTGSASRAVTPFSADERFPALSITKTFTAALVLREVEAGRLILDAAAPPVAGVRPPATPVTIRQLLTHTTGLIDYATSPNYRAGAGMTPADAVNLSTDFPQTSAPGTAVAYANTNFLYLQLILEAITAKPYGTLIGDLVAELGLTATALEPPDRNGWIGGASGGLRSTVADLARWSDGLFTPGRVLAPGRLLELQTIDQRGAGMGTWPICPCSTDTAGARHYTALGHHTASGAMEFYPATGLSVAVRIDPANGDAGGFAAELGVRLSHLFAPR